MTELMICPTCDIEFYGEKGKFCSRSCWALMGRHKAQQKRQKLIEWKPASKVFHGHNVEVPIHKEIEAGYKKMGAGFWYECW